MKNFIGLILLALLLFSCVNEIENVDTTILPDEIFQYSSKDGLLNHEYIGDLTMKEIKEKGNFGLGTFNMVNGEMVIFNGNVYQVLPNGTVNNIEAQLRSPFVVTKFFQPDTTFSLPANISLDSVKTILNKIVERKNIPAAIKIVSNFTSLKSRSVDEASDLSVTLEEIIAKQTEFNFTNVQGNVIGFWYPDYFDGVNFPGFHFHVLLDDLTGGGHMLNCTIANGNVEIDYASGVNVDFIEDNAQK